MSQLPQPQQHRGRPGIGAIRRPAVALLTALVLAAGPALSQDAQLGHFEVRSAATELRGGVYYLTATIDLTLSSEAEMALDSGLPLTLRFEVEFLNRLRLWWDAEEASLRQLYRIEWHPLTERYVVLNVNSGDRMAYPSLRQALDDLGRINALPLIDAAVLDRDRRYDVRLRAVLDTEQLPGPLRLLAFWRRDWSLGSEWFRWRLDDN